MKLSLLFSTLFIFSITTEAKLKEHAKDGIKDQYIVQLKDDGSLNDEKSIQDKSDKLIKAHGGKRTKSVFQKAIKGFVVNMNSAQAKKLSEDPSVEFVEQDLSVKPSQTTTVPWGLDRIDQAAGPLDGVYLPNQSGRGVHAYVIDSGIRTTHTEFQGRADVVYDAINDGSLDCMGHGTHVAGTIGGSTYGVAKNVSLHSVRIMGCGNTTVSMAIGGIDWVTRHGLKPAVVNLSIAVIGDSDTLDRAVKNSISRGYVYILSANNNNMDACYSSPAHVPEAITVGATYFDRENNKDVRFGVSNWGPCVDIFAPGVGIDSAGNWDDVSKRNMSGTSMAAPHVAGVAALLLETNPLLTPAEVSNALKRDALAGILNNLEGTNSPNLLLNAKITTSSRTPASTDSTVESLISVSTGSTYILGSRINIVGRITQNGVGVSGKTINFVITKPNGSTVALKGTTNTTGEVVVTYRQSRKDTVGLYSVKASSSASSSVATTTFTVN